jgi:hypothetical protein
MLPAAAAWSAPTVQSHPWHIGVGGGYSSGYWGMLARMGLPRERLLEQRVTDPDYLRQFNAILLASSWGESSSLTNAVERYVQEGGIAVTEFNARPSTAALPGRRISERKGPNLRFVPSPCPVSEGLPQLGVITLARRPAISIIPDAGRPDTYVLARFTDEAATADVIGTFKVDGEQAPAMLLFRYGKGWWLWAGTWLGYFGALRGTEFDQAVLNTLRFASGGELVPRFDQKALSAQQLLTTPQALVIPERRRPGRGEAQAPPESFEVLDDSLEQAGDFDLKGTVAATRGAEVVSAYWSPQQYRAVRLTGDRLCVVRVEGGRETEVASTTVAARNGSRALEVRRRNGDVFVRLDGRPVLSALDGPAQQGVVAARGVDDCSFHAAEPVDFTDDFMRLPTEASEWQALAGTWAVQQDKGDRNAGEINMSANPFRFEAKAPAEGPGRAVVGQWFWDDCDLSVAVRPQAARVALLGHWRGPGDCIGLRVGVTKDPAAAVETELVQWDGGTERVLARAPGGCRWDQWAKLGLRLSGGYLQGLLNGQVVVQALDEVRACGQAGLAVEGGTALFDDFSAQAWEAMPRSYGTDASLDWDAERGTFQVTTGAEPAVVVRGKPDARVLSAWTGLDAYRCWTTVKLGNAPAAGLYLRYQGPRQYYLAALTRGEDGKTHVQLRRANRGEETVLADKALEGDRSLPRTLLVEATGDRLQVFVDGQPCADLTDEGPRWGRVGLYASSEAPAEFRTTGALPVDQAVHLVDDLTPGFAGIIDRNIWAGKANFLYADPQDLNLFWHRGQFAGDVTVKLGVRKQPGVPTTVASLCLGDATGLSGGYEVRITRNWDEADVKVDVLRRGEAVAQGTARLPSTRDAFEAELSRSRGALICRLDGEAALTYRDAEPLDARWVGMKLVGSAINPDDTRVETPDARSCTFAQAATDWLPESGTWEVSSRWSCTPGWTWYAGWGDKDTWTTTREAFVGDQRVDAFMGCKMMDVPGNPDRKKEVLQDLRIGLCTTPGDPNSGYRFIVGGRDNTWTAIQKNGVTLAEVRWSLPQAGMHNDWTLISAMKRGNELRLEWEGNILVRCTDPDPLPAGRVSLGTYNNGVLIPKVTIYAQPQAPSAPSS